MRSTAKIAERTVGFRPMSLNQRWASLGASLAVAGLWMAVLSVPAAYAAPANDDFATAQQLGGALPIAATGSTAGATLQQGEPVLHSASGGHSIWFRWEATSTEVVTVGSCGSEIPAIIGIFTGTSVGSLTEVAENVWDWPGCGIAEGVQATFKANAGKVYSIQVDGSTYHEASQPSISGEGEVAIQIRHRDAPDNDDFANAETLQLGSLSQSVSTFGATKEAGEPNHHGDKGGASVWFKFTASRTGGALIQLSGGQIGHEGLIAVYTGATVDALTPIPADEIWGSSTLVFPVSAGMTYRIAVDGKYDPSTGSPFMDERQISGAAFPGNDDFEHAWELPFGPPGGTWGINGLGSVGASKQPGEPSHAGDPGGASVWFSVAASASGSVQFSACGANFPTLLAVYTGSAVGGLTPIAADGDLQSPPCGYISGSGELGFNVDAGTTYWIAVDGYGGAWGTFDIRIQTSTKRLPETGRDLAVDTPLRTKIARRHVNRRQRVAVFHLSANDPNSDFVCKLDSRPFTPCSSTIVYKKLNPGWHTFRSRAVSESGRQDPTPVAFSFKIPRRHH